MGMSPTQLTLRQLRQDGYLCQVVEHWNPFARRRVDLFGIIDVLACRPNELWGIQCTSAANHSARREKARETPELQSWLAAGGRFAIWSWKKVKNRWKLRSEELFAEDTSKMK